MTLVDSLRTKGDLRLGLPPLALSDALQLCVASPDLTQTPSVASGAVRRRHCSHARSLPLPGVLARALLLLGQRPCALNICTNPE